MNNKGLGSVFGYGTIEEIIPMRSEAIFSKIKLINNQRAEIERDVIAKVPKPPGEMVIELTFDEQKRWDLFIKASKEWKIECGKALNLIKGMVSDEIYGEMKIDIPNCKEYDCMVVRNIMTYFKRNYGSYTIGASRKDEQLAEEIPLFSDWAKVGSYIAKFRDIMKERETWGAQFEKDDQYKISWLIHRLVATDLWTTRGMIENLMYSSPPGRFTFNGAVKMVFDKCKISRERNLFLVKSWVVQIVY